KFSRTSSMRDLLLFLHLAAAIFWLGGMAFMVLALRPAAHALLEPPLRLALMAQVLRRFFLVVIASVAVLLVTGVWLMLQVRGMRPPIGWHVMSGLGILMMLIFGHIFFGPYRRLKAAVAAADWPAGAGRMNQISLLVKLNLGLGWLAI